jgi:hypothetical protein
MMQMQLVSGRPKREAIVMLLTLESYRQVIVVGLQMAHGSGCGVIRVVDVQVFVSEKQARLAQEVDFTVASGNQESE